MLKNLRVPQNAGPKISRTLTLQVPAAILALKASGAFAEGDAQDTGDLHEIESYGPVGFDFVEADAVHQTGPFVISEDILDAVHTGQVDMELAMSVYWDDVPRVLAPDQEDTAWVEAALAGLTFDPIDRMDMSFGVAELPAEAFFAADDLIVVPPIDDFLI